MTHQPFPAGISIFKKDTVATFTWGEPPRLFAIVSKENEEEYRTYFLTLWKQAKP